MNRVAEPPSQTSAPRPFRQTLAGRLFILSGAVLAVVLLAQQLLPQPRIVEIFRKVLWLAFIGSGVWIGTTYVMRNRRWWFWRVRRKLILSYVFLGAFPVALVAVFTLMMGFVLYTNIASYLFHQGLKTFSDDVAQIAETSAAELTRAPETAAVAIGRKQANLAAQYPELSLAVVHVTPPLPPGTNADPKKPATELVTAAGPWRHVAPPAVVPAWVSIAGNWTGVLAYRSPGSTDPDELLIRSVAFTTDRQRVVIADLPISADIVARIDRETSTRMGGVSVEKCAGGTRTQQESSNRPFDLFRQTVATVACLDWDSGIAGSAKVTVRAPLRNVYKELASAEGAAGITDVLLPLLGVLAGFFLIIQGAALFLGAVLGKSITSAVHELFVGVERIRQGDFTYRIRIESRDQLGDLAESFNRMSASMEHLLHVQREKQRLDDELRIARDIQKSLLPVDLPQIPGLDLADLCEPAREVGGDYYDFFLLGPRQLGVLIADVSGKGTSAALYMAELKGLLLALSHNEPSPRKLLIDVNRRLVNHLDNRSFITMTYAVIDLDARTLTCARAGHTPLIAVSGGETKVIIPDGMILGVRLPGAARRFEDLLSEHTQPIAPGDVFILYTDGITEAMDRDGELFGDAALANIVSTHRELDAVGIRERVLREVRAFVGDAEPHDDMTMVVMKVNQI